MSQEDAKTLDTKHIRVIAASSGITQLRRVMDLIDQGNGPAEIRYWAQEQIARLLEAWV